MKLDTGTVISYFLGKFPRGGERGSLFPVCTPRICNKNENRIKNTAKIPEIQCCDPIVHSLQIPTEHLQRDVLSRPEMLNVLQFTSPVTDIHLGS